MKLGYFFLSSALVFALCRFVVIPFLLRRSRGEPGGITKATLVRTSLVGMISIVSLAASAGALCSALLVWFLTGVRGSTAEELSNALATVNAWQARLQGLGAAWCLVLTVLIVAGAGIYFRRKAQRRYDGAFNELITHELDRLKQKADREGGLERLPPTPRMVEIAGIIGNYQSEIERLARLPGSGAEAAVAQVQSFMEKAIQAYRSIDIERRLNLKLTPEDVALPEGEGFWGRVGTVLISRGWAGHLTASSRRIAIGLLLITIPGFIGFASPLVRPSLEDEAASLTVQLEDLQFAANREEANQSWKNAVAALPADRAEQKLSDDDQQTIALAAAFFEAQAYASVYRNFHWHGKGGGSDGPYKPDAHASSPAGTAGQTVAVEPAPELVPENYNPGGRSRRIASIILQDHAAFQSTSVAAKGRPERPKATNAADAHLQMLADLADGPHRLLTPPPAGGGLEPSGGAGSPKSPPDAGPSARGPPTNGGNGGGGTPKPGPASDLGRLLQERFELIARKDASFVGRLKTGMGTMRSQLRPGDLPHIVFQEVVGIQFGSHSSPLANKPQLNVGYTQAWKGLNAGLADRISTLLLKSGDPMDVAARLKTSLVEHPLAPPRLIPATQAAFASATSGSVSLDVLRDVDRSAPFLESKMDAASEQRLRAHLDHYFAKSGLGDRRTAILDLVEDYSSLFNPTTKSLKQTLARSVQQNWGDADYVKNKVTAGTSAQRTAITAVEPLSERSVKSAEQNVEGAVGRSRSFNRSQGYHRVGGVLLGRMPDGAASSLDLVDIGWQKTSGELWQLTCMARDGNTMTSPAVSAEILYRSLLYAADERPLTVTIINTSLPGAQKVMLNPALVDSALGLQVMTLDKFVFDLVEPEWIRQSQASVDATEDIYSLAWAARIFAINRKKEALLDNVAPDGRSGAAELLAASTQDVESLCKRILGKYASSMQGQILVNADSATLAPLVAALQIFASADAARKTPVCAKTEFYDLTLIGHIMSHARSADLGSEPGQVVRQFLGGMGSATDAVFRDLEGNSNAYSSFASTSSVRVRQEAAFQELANLAFRPPPETSVASGVRENDYRLDHDNLFSPGSTGLPFRFMMQVAFESQPYFLKSSGRDRTVYFDESPWEFPWIAAEVEKRTLLELQAGAGDLALKQQRDSALKAASLFTVFQRFFRNAFAERAGPDFPLEKLIQLGAELRTLQPPFSRTPRWNLNLDDPRMLKTSTEILAQAIKGVTPQSVTTALADHVTGWIQLLDEEVTAEKAHRKKVLELLRSTARAASWQAQWDELWQKRKAARLAWENRWMEQVDAAAAGVDPSPKTGDGESSQLATSKNVIEYARKFAAGFTIAREQGLFNEERDAYLRLTPGEIGVQWEKTARAN